MTLILINQSVNVLFYVCSQQGDIRHPLSFLLFNFLYIFVLGNIKHAQISNENAAFEQQTDYYFTKKQQLLMEFGLLSLLLVVSGEVCGRMQAR